MTIVHIKNSGHWIDSVGEDVLTIIYRKKKYNKIHEDKKECDNKKIYIAAYSCEDDVKETLFVYGCVKKGRGVGFGLSGGKWMFTHDKIIN